VNLQNAWCNSKESLVVLSSLLRRPPSYFGFDFVIQIVCQLNGIILYYRVSSGTSDKSWLKECCDFIAVFSVGLPEGPESSIYFLTKAMALVNAANNTHACNTFQHYMT
jgi:hypothetical protein